MPALSWHNLIVTGVGLRQEDMQRNTKINDIYLNRFSFCFIMIYRLVTQRDLPNWIASEKEWHRNDPIVSYPFAG